MPNKPFNLTAFRCLAYALSATLAQHQPTYKAANYRGVMILKVVE